MALPFTESEHHKDAQPRKTQTSKINVAQSRSLYETDYYGWVLQQVKLLKAGQLDALDTKNIAEELGDMGKSEYKSLRSALCIVLLHMLKWDFQSDKRSWSWFCSIRTHRRHVLEILDDNPSLKSKKTRAVQQAYQDARDGASAESGLKLGTFPETCPYSWQDILERPFSWDESEQD
jgi:hypothetical protein